MPASSHRFHSKTSNLKIWNEIYFKKIDSNTKNNLEGAKFSISSLNNQVQIEITQNYNDGVYEIPNQSIESQYQDLIQFLPSDIVNELNQINSYNELQLYAQNHDYSLSDYCTWDEGYCSYIGFEIPVKLKEVRSPIGYQKTDYILPAYTIIYFNFKDGSDVVNNKQVDIETGSTEEHVLYQYNNQYNNHIGVTQYFKRVSEDSEDLLSLVDILNSKNYYSYECDGVYYNKYSEQSDHCDIYVPLVEDDVGELVLRLDDTIEGKKEYNTTGDTKATYKIHAINSGTASAGDNQVSITIPKGLTIDTASISDHGVYNPDNRQITWTIDYLDNETDEEVTFDIIISSGTKGTFTLSSQITNGQDATAIAEETTINVINNKVINPNTGVQSYTIIFTLILIISVTLYAILRKKKNYIMK